MSLGLGPGAPPYTMQIMIAGCAVLGLTINVGYALIFSTDAMGQGYRKSRRWIEGTMAALFGYAGFRLLFSKP